jgi:hypothetical protein
MNHPLQDPESTCLLGLGDAGQHSQLDGPDYRGRLLETSSATRREPRGKSGLVGSPAGPPHAVVFETTPIAFALRDVVPGTDLASAAQPGIGAAIWLHATEVQAIHDALVADGHTVVSAPIDGPFGRTFTFAGPDGYRVTLHDRA